MKACGDRLVMLSWQVRNKATLQSAIRPFVVSLMVARSSTEFSLVHLRGDAMQQDYKYRSVQLGNCKQWSTLQESHLARYWKQQ